MKHFLRCCSFITFSDVLRHNSIRRIVLLYCLLKVAKIKVFPVVNFGRDTTKGKSQKCLNVNKNSIVSTKRDLRNIVCFLWRKQISKEKQHENHLISTEDELTQVDDDDDDDGYDASGSGGMPCRLGGPTNHPGSMVKWFLIGTSSLVVSLYTPFPPSLITSVSVLNVEMCGENCCPQGRLLQNYYHQDSLEGFCVN